MKSSTLLALLALTFTVGTAAVYTEFAATGTGDNHNPGSGLSDTPALMYWSAATPSAWNPATGIFTVASGSPLTDMPGIVSDGTHFASVYPNGATSTGYSALIIGAGANWIQLSLTNAGGTPPPADSTGMTTMRIDGAFAGPSGAIGIPFTLCNPNMKDAAGHMVCVNIKDKGTSYTITTQMTVPNINGIMLWSGYSTAFRDRGRPKFDGGIAAVGYILLRSTADFQKFQDFDFAHNGLSNVSGAYGIYSTGLTTWERVAVHHMHGTGINGNGKTNFFGLDIYSNDTGNFTKCYGMISGTDGSVVAGCYIHDQFGTNAGGAHFDGCPTFVRNRIRHNTFGVDTNGTNYFRAYDSDFYDNPNGHFIARSGVGTIYLHFENTNFFKSAMPAIQVGGTVMFGEVRGCHFGTGTMANGSGHYAYASYIEEEETHDYTANAYPWADPDHGDFSVVNTESEFVGYGDSFQTTTTPQNVTQGFPDVGSAPHHP